MKMFDKFDKNLISLIKKKILKTYSLKEEGMQII